jgi:chromosome segregation ATPase
MLFWVVDANTGEINTTSVSIIKNHVGNIPLYIVINKVDSKSPDERNQIENQMRKTLKNAQILVQGYIQFSKDEPLEKMTSIIESVKPRRPDYDVIQDIYDWLDERINENDVRIKAEKKELNQYNRAINQAQSIIEAFQDRYSNKTDQFNRLSERIQSDEFIGSTLFGNGNKRCRLVLGFT